jgi:ribosomal peptide maturation radical SAM protein 1
MPWQSLPRPSLAVGVLRGACVADGLPAPQTYHGGLRFAEFLLEHSGGQLRPFEYHAVGETGFSHALGDWIFAGVLNEPDFGYAQMHDYAARKGIPMRTIGAMREYADEFIELVVDEILALEPELVGFSTTFMQNVPSLAAARRLKARRPDIAVLFGGGNCDGPMGAALHRAFDFVDLVLSGESDETFPFLLRALGERDTDRLVTVPTLCWRDQDGRQRINKTPARLVPPAKMARPLFDDWFARFAASPIGRHIEPELAVESARGCWWGEHHHCTFCGLNGTGMTFRAKPAEVFVAELSELLREHQVLDVMVVDNILEPGYVRTALPALARHGWDVRLHYEVKANLTLDQIRMLRSAGVFSVQPGIESFVDDVLVRMRKGVRAVHNVRTMRDCESVGLMVSWNWIYGFPGEKLDDYEAVLAQLPALVHLQPPTSIPRIELDRFSPYFEDPSLGFPIRKPAEPYQYVYDLPTESLHDLVYLFDTPPKGLTEEEIAPLHELVRSWHRDHSASSLRQQNVDGVVVIRDRRTGWPTVDHVLETPREVATWRELEHGRSNQGLLRRLEEASLPWQPDELARWLSELRDHGLVFTEGGRWVALATTVLPDEMAGKPVNMLVDAAVM